MKTLQAALIALAATNQPVFAAGINGEWCAPDEPEILIDGGAIGFVDSGCSPKSGPLQIGVAMPMLCTSEEGGGETTITLTLSGDTLTVTEDGTETVYRRCR